MSEPKEKIPREQDPAKVAEMMDMSACRLDSVDDAWHVLCTARSTVGWHDRKIVKNHFDLARYFHLMYWMKPEIVVETGLQGGGSVLFFLDALGMLGLSETPYIGIDLNAQPALDAVRLHHPDRPVMLISADCLADATVREVAPFLRDRRALLVLDSVHSESHVTEELRLYASLLAKGSHLVVEDTDHSGFPILKTYGESAHHAVEKFMQPGGLGRKLGFVHDYKTERMFGPFTNSPNGWLKKTR